jgi:HPt (histidine-containing phosphotransfer) domain-containing protein
MLDLKGALIMSQPECTALADAWTIPEQLVELATDDPSLLPELIGVFQEDTQARLRLLRAAASAGDAIRVRAEAHTIKGSSRQIGAASLADACQQLEMHAMSMPQPAMAGAAEEIESRFAEVRVAMGQYFGER